MMTKQDNTDDPMRAIGMSAVERAIRQMLERITRKPDDEVFIVTVGEMRSLMRDLDMWREIVRTEIELRKLEEP